jgi:ankyrin repeat protein
MACQTDHYDIVELLMHKGAITDKTYEGMLPLEYAISKGHIAIAELLRPGIMEALKATKGKSSTISAQHLAALAPIRANARFRQAQEAARRAR